MIEAVSGSVALLLAWISLAIIEGSANKPLIDGRGRLVIRYGLCIRAIALLFVLFLVAGLVSMVADGESVGPILVVSALLAVGSVIALKMRRVVVMGKVCIHYGRGGGAMRVMRWRNVKGVKFFSGRDQIVVRDHQSRAVKISRQMQGFADCWLWLCKYSEKEVWCAASRKFREQSR